MLGILEYGAGNQTSVRRALEYIGVPAIVAASQEELAACEGVIFPGVGSAGQAMDQLSASGLDLVLKELVGMGKPLLGICLGCQILLEESEEESRATLGILPGVSKKFDSRLRDSAGINIRIPHMGWNGLRISRGSPLFANIPAGTEFYFVHGYHPVPPEALIIATAVHGEEFVAAYGRPGLWGVQFHPEKSGRPGLKLLENFYRWCREQGDAC